VQALNAAGYRTITPDLPGLGKSDKPADLDPYNMQTSVTPAMVALLDALALQQVSVVGHDLGTGLAWGLAFACPERVNKVVTLSVGYPGRPGTAAQAH
jgi:pimeloyl-ACP methyl ester carboxylesterase